MIRNSIIRIWSVVIVVTIAAGTVACTGGEDGSGGGDVAVTIPRVDATPFEYPDYTDTQLSTVPSGIGVAYTTFSDDPANPHFAHREKPLTSEYTQTQLAQLERAFRVAWLYYHTELGIDLGSPQQADSVTGVQADGLVHKWNWNWLVQNLVGGDNAKGDPWDDEFTVSALLITSLDVPDPDDPDSWTPPQVFVVTDEVLLDYDRGPTETGIPLENLNNTRTDRQIFEKGLFDIIAIGERAVWKVWESDSE